jgi:DNA-binding MarR family transcriptional regulator
MANPEDQHSTTLTDSDAVRIMRLADELARVIRSASQPIDDANQASAEELLQINRRWQRIAGAPLFRVSQSMLLELYCSPEGRKTVTALCNSIHAPIATGVRQIAALRRDGLIEMLSDPLDRRLRLAALTQAGRGFIERVLVG